MKTHVEFRSDLFPPYPGEEDEINSGRWGKRLAEFIRDGLKERDFDVMDPFAEDWGWMVEIRNEAFPLWIGCGNIDGEDDAFLSFIEPSKPFVRKLLFKKISTEADVTKLQTAFDSVLSSEPSIKEIRWSSKEEFGS
ncbi:MAG: hypothetical protein ABL984_14925 [Pyrinomonadaceae bacterium]